MKVKHWIAFIAVILLIAFSIGMTYAYIKERNAHDVVSADFAKLKDVYARDTAYLKRGLSELSSGLSDSLGTIDRLEASLRASNKREREATEAIGRILAAGLSRSGEAEKAVARLADFGERVAVQLGLKGEGVPGPTQ
jgi:hypothetical protein